MRDHETVTFLTKLGETKWVSHPLFKRALSLVHEDLSETYSRDIQKWLLVAPIIGIVTGSRSPAS